RRSSSRSQSRGHRIRGNHVHVRQELQEIEVVPAFYESIILDPADACAFEAHRSPARTFGHLHARADDDRISRLPKLRDLNVDPGKSTSERLVEFVKLLCADDWSI